MKPKKSLCPNKLKRRKMDAKNLIKYKNKSKLYKYNALRGISALVHLRHQHSHFVDHDDRPINCYFL